MKPPVGDASTTPAAPPADPKGTWVVPVLLIAGFVFGFMALAFVALTLFAGDQVRAMWGG